MEETNGDHVYAGLSDAVKARIDVIEVFSEIDSTNTYLLLQAAPGIGRCRVALAEHQTAGRGQRGNTWESPPQAGLYLSCSYTFAQIPSQFSCVTLAVGTGLAEALTGFGINGVELKWPNDLVLQNGKLGGILTEVRSGDTDSATVVVGIGLNLDYGEQLKTVSANIGRVSDLRQAVDELPRREVITISVVEHLIDSLVRFEAAGFSQFRKRWNKRDWLLNKAVRVESANGEIHGIAAGIDDDGALLVNNDDGIVRIVSGTVMLHENSGDAR